jgi:hypothetical protein
MLALNEGIEELIRHILEVLLQALAYFDEERSKNPGKETSLED